MESLLVMDTTINNKYTGENFHPKRSWTLNSYASQLLQELMLHKLWQRVIIQLVLLHAELCVLKSQALLLTVLMFLIAEILRSVFFDA